MNKTGQSVAGIGQSLAVNSGVESFVCRAVLLSWLAYLLIAPTIGFQWIDSWHNEQRAVQLILLCCTGLVYSFTCIGARSRDDTFNWSLPAGLLAFLGLGVLSALQSQFKFPALTEVGLTALLAILALFTAQVVAMDVPRYVRWARWFALLFATAYVLGVATRYLAAVNLERPIDLDVLILGYANPRFASAFHAVLIPFIALTVLESKESWGLRSGAAIVLSLLWAINIGLGTRGIWFAYALAVPSTALLAGWRPSARLLAVIAVTAAAGILFYFLFFAATTALTAAGSVLGAPTDNLKTLSSRETLWQLSWKAIVSSPWLGIGPMQFAALDSDVGAHPHNWVLQIAAEWGLPALVLVLYGVLRLCRAVKQANHRDSPVLVMSGSAALALGLVDGNLVMPISQSATVLTLGILLGSLHQPGSREPVRRVSAPALAITAFICALAGGLVIAYAADTLSDQAGGVSIFQKAHPGAWLVPRFWEQGLLF